LKHFAFTVLMAASLMSCDFGRAPDYQYRTITGDTAYSDWKQSRGEAMELVQAEFDAFVKNECRRAIANGWALHQVTNEGAMNCEQTPEGYHCRKKNVEVECRQISEFFP
jgi:hypothetical protein